MTKENNALIAITVLFALIRELAKIADKLESGEIDPGKVNIIEWNKKLKELENLTK